MAADTDFRKNTPYGKQKWKKETVKYKKFKNINSNLKLWHEKLKRRQNFQVGSTKTISKIHTVQERKQKKNVLNAQTSTNVRDVQKSEMVKNFLKAVKYTKLLMPY